MLLNILWCTGQPLTTEDPSLQNVNSATAGKPCLDPCSQVPSLFPGNIILNELVLNIFLLSEAWFQQHSSNQHFTFFLSNPKMWSSVLLLRNKGCCVNQRGRIILALPFHLLLAFPSPAPTMTASLKYRMSWDQWLTGPYPARGAISWGAVCPMECPEAARFISAASLAGSGLLLDWLISTRLTLWVGSGPADFSPPSLDHFIIKLKIVVI